MKTEIVYFYIFVVLHFVRTYKPIVLVHGLFNGPKSWKNYVKFIEKYHSGTPVFALDFFDDVESIAPFAKQITTVINLIEDLKKSHNTTFDNGYHLITTSQGGIISRGVIEEYDMHGVDTFISLSGPLMGFFGEPFDLPKWLDWLEGMTLHEITQLFYSHLIQKEFGMANYWRDSTELEKYLKNNIFLPRLNNEVDHPDMERYKRNFLKINKMVCIGGLDDEVISPWQSSHFGFYKENTLPHENQIVEYNEQEIYLNDTFGLRTLDEENRFFIHTVSGRKHFDWKDDEEIFETLVLIHLT